MALQPEGREEMRQEERESRLAATALSITLIGISGGVIVFLKDLPIDPIARSLLRVYFAVVVLLSTLIQYLHYVGQSYNSKFIATARLAEIAATIASNQADTPHGPSLRRVADELNADIEPSYKKSERFFTLMHTLS